MVHEPLNPNEWFNFAKIWRGQGVMNYLLNLHLSNWWVKGWQLHAVGEECTLKRSVVISIQKVLFQNQNKHISVTVFKHVSVFMHDALMSFQTVQHLFESKSVCI